jgi:3-deoxy-7-phosphoheptulonate synthase
MDLRVMTMELPTPASVIEQFPLTDEDKTFIANSRETIADLLHCNTKERLLVIVGPCSIHNPTEALEYAQKLSELRDSLSQFFIVMRVYFEKPRTRGGWKGYLYDPHLNETNDILTGIQNARKLMCEITQKYRLPIATEFLDTITPQYFSDIVSYGAIGARTVESQIHRQLASGLSMPTGMKNRTDGDITTAIDAIISATSPHSFLGVGHEGQATRVDTSGNEDVHLILRGGGSQPNYDFEHVQKIAKQLEKESINTNIVIDLNHGNSNKNFRKQLLSALHVWRMWKTTTLPIAGIMIESNLEEGKQELCATLRKGVSITDACLSFQDTAILFQLLERSRVILEKRPLDEYRAIIADMDALFEAPVFFASDYITNYDTHILHLTQETKKLLTYGVRCAVADAIAEVKFNLDPFKFLLKSNDILTQVQDIERERFLNLEPALMDLSKRIQTANILHKLKNIKIGYLYGLGTFSHETVSEFFHGIHISYKDIVMLNTATLFGEVDFALIPIYNNIIGPIFSVHQSSKQIGVVHKQLHFTLYANCEKIQDIQSLFVEPHVEREAHNFIHSKLSHTHKREMLSTREGIGAVLASRSNAATIASSKALGESLLYRLAEEIVPNNFTTFAVVKKVETSHF